MTKTVSHKVASTPTLEQLTEAEVKEFENTVAAGTILDGDGNDITEQFHSFLLLSLKRVAEATVKAVRVEHKNDRWSCSHGVLHHAADTLYCPICNTQAPMESQLAADDNIAISAQDQKANEWLDNIPKL